MLKYIVQIKMEGFFLFYFFKLKKTFNKNNLYIKSKVKSKLIVILDSFIKSLQSCLLLILYMIQKSCIYQLNHIL